jgi:hypothetical protein
MDGGYITQKVISLIEFERDIAAARELDCGDASARGGKVLLRLVSDGAQTVERT